MNEGNNFFEKAKKSLSQGRPSKKGPDKFQTAINEALEKICRK